MEKPSCIFFIQKIPFLPLRSYFFLLSRPMKDICIYIQATLNVGGNTISAHAIEHYILRKPTSPIIKEVNKIDSMVDIEVVSFYTPY